MVTDETPHMEVIGDLFSRALDTAAVEDVVDRDGKGQQRADQVFLVRRFAPRWRPHKPIGRSQWGSEVVNMGDARVVLRSANGRPRA